MSNQMMDGWMVRTDNGIPTWKTLKVTLNRYKMKLNIDLLVLNYTQINFHHSKHFDFFLSTQSCQVSSAAMFQRQPLGKFEILLNILKILNAWFIWSRIKPFSHHRTANNSLKAWWCSIKGESRKALEFEWINFSLWIR